jgi:Organic radical activating enzymes
MKIHLSTEYPESTTDGHGIRYSIYVQGCRGGLHGDCIRNCPGCHNPETWSFAKNAPGSYWLTIEDLVEKIRAHKLSWGKLTLCGGDPIWQVEECIELVKQLKKLKPDFNVWAYSGLSYDYILNSANEKNHWKEYLEMLDVLVDGPFLLKQRDITLPWRGSPNQRVIDIKKTTKKGKVVLVEDD